jgi:hypothetical protein
MTGYSCCGVCSDIVSLVSRNHSAQRVVPARHCSCTLPTPLSDNERLNLLSLLSPWAVRLGYLCCLMIGMPPDPCRSGDERRR